MSLQPTLGPLGPHGGTVDPHAAELLDGEDSIVIVVARKQITTYARGFNLSGCQLELLAMRIERAVRRLMSLNTEGDEDAARGRFGSGRA